MIENDRHLPKPQEEYHVSLEADEKQGQSAPPFCALICPLPRWVE